MSTQQRLLGEHFRPDGRPKQSWPTQAEAERAAFLYNKRSYRCDFCRQYHIGGKAR